MHLIADAVILTTLPHGEHGAVVRVLTPDDGLRTGYVPGGRGRRVRPILTPGNRVVATLKARGDTQLGGLSVEPVASRALLSFAPAAAAAVDWLTRLTAATLPEGDAHPALFAALDGLLDAMDGDLPVWAPGIARYELLLLGELGFGLDLAHCALTSAVDDLAFVSPHSGRAVARGAIAGEAWADKLLPLPEFLLRGGAASPAHLADALALTAHFLPRLPGLTPGDLDGARARFARLALAEQGKNAFPAPASSL